jgi:hypothetical protein
MGGLSLFLERGIGTEQVEERGTKPSYLLLLGGLGAEQE